ncbi:hypothetical protein [Ideonella sp. YS5]|uniref:hypothetical protein n=1 Tax=Ideonella sp. YS5 TaxID=3453714 RepID=UPI003EEBF709
MPGFPLLMPIAAAATQVARRPYLSASVLVHAALLALLYYFGSYQLELREQEEEVASSLRATSQASAAKRLQDLQTIKQLLQKSADRVDPQHEPGPAPAAVPQTPEQMLEQARELSREIDALDQEIRAEELTRLTGVPQPPPAADPPPAAVPRAPVAEAGAASANAAPQANGPQAQAQAEERAASEMAELEAKARATLAKRQQRLEAKANGVQVEGDKTGTGGEGAGNRTGAQADGSRTGAQADGSRTGAQADGSRTAAQAAEGRQAGSTVSAEIADFMGAGDGAERTSSSKNYSGSDFFDRGRSQIPPVDAKSLVLGRGRMLGAGGEYANRVYLNSWYLIGPFAGRHEAGLFDNPSYPPEKAVLLDAVYYGKDKRLVKWRYVTSQSYPLVPPDMVEDSVYYGYTEVLVDEACDLTAWIGADDDVQVYLNDRLVWKGGNVNKQSYFDAVFNSGAAYLRDYNRTEGRRVLHFDKGRNRIFFKLSNGPNAAYLSMVLTR